MIETIIKRDGSKQPFMAEKINRWAEYGAKHGADWTIIAIETVKRLPKEATSESIHQTMIDVCIEQETLEFSRVAARLELAKISKTLESVNLSTLDEFYVISKYLVDIGVWDEKILIDEELVNEWYFKLYPIKLEYWQIKQFADKYGLKYNGEMIETPHIAALGIGIAHFGEHENAYKLAKAILEGKINLPTPALNGGRNGDFDSVSCCVITGGDSVDSIGVAEHIAYKMTAKKAGIGIEFQTRSKGAPVKGGRVEHLGKHGIYATVDKAVKMFTQVTRGGSATVTYSAIDPQIMEMLLWKTQKVDIEQRLDKLDYSMAYNDAFVQAVVKDLDWYLFDLLEAPEVHELFYNDPDDDFGCAVDFAIKSGKKYTVVKARDLLKRFLTARQETGRVYCFNVTRANTHTPFIDTIYLSNLCQEICLPTKHYEGMSDLYVGTNGTSTGETAFCSLAAINVGKVDFGEYFEIAELALRVVDSMIEKAPAMTATMEESIRRRRSVGIGMTGLAQYLYKNDSDYDGSEESLRLVSLLSELHYHSLLMASQKMVTDGTCEPVSGITDWLPVDTTLNKFTPDFDWEELRGKPRGHSVLVAHMPTESSAVFSGATNGLYPPRTRITYKQSRKGAVQFIVDKEDFIPAWDVGNIVMSKYYSRVQDFSDQGISADYYVVPERHPNGKVPLSALMKEWIAQARLGIKSMYYTNTKVNETVQVKDIVKAGESEEDGCESCKL